MDASSSEAHRRRERVHCEQGGALWRTSVGQGVARDWFLPPDRRAVDERPVGPGADRSRRQSAGGRAVAAHALCRRPLCDIKRHFLDQRLALPELHIVPTMSWDENAQEAWQLDSDRRRAQWAAQDHSLNSATGLIAVPLPDLRVP